MFVVIGIGVACYVAYALLTGELVAKSGISARTVRRTENPVYYWTCVGIYTLLAVALMTIF